MAKNKLRIAQRFALTAVIKSEISSYFQNSLYFLFRLWLCGCIFSFTSGLLDECELHIVRR